VAQAESGGYADAVGDIALADAKWSYSFGLFQIRALHHPEQYPFPDTLRVPSKLKSVAFQAYAAYEISHHGVDWSKWSTWRSNAYAPYAGRNFTIKYGHRSAAEWPASP